MANKKWPPPGFPLVEGDHALTTKWSIHLPEQFARRVEDGDLVLWRPGLTIWLAAWNNDHEQSPSVRLASIKESTSPARFAEVETETYGVVRFSYRLRDENGDGHVESLYAFIIDGAGHLQIAVYFDDPNDEDKARQLVDSVAVRDS